MANTEETAANWVHIISARADLPFGDRFKKHFERSKLTRLCACGCNSFDCETPADQDLAPLFEIVGKPNSLEAVFESDSIEPINIRIFANSHGMLSGIEVHFGLGNQAPMPENVQLGKLIFTIPEL
jgi:hypothetical protein